MDVGLDMRSEVGVDDGRVAPVDQLDGGDDVAGEGDILKTHRFGKCADQLFVRREAVRVQQHDAERCDPVRFQFGQQRLEFMGVRSPFDDGLAVDDDDAFVDADGALVELSGFPDVEVEQLRAVLVADGQGVLEPFRDQEHGARPLAFEHCVGGDCRSHADPADVPRFDLPAGNTDAQNPFEQPPDALARRIRIVFGIA